MMVFFIFSEFRKGTVGSTSRPEGYQVQLSIALKCSLSCLFISALSRKMMLFWVLLYLFCSFIVPVILKNVKGFSKRVGPLNPTCSSVDR